MLFVKENRGIKKIFLETAQLDGNQFLNVIANLLVTVRMTFCCCTMRVMSIWMHLRILLTFSYICVVCMWSGQIVKVVK